MKSHWKYSHSSEVERSPDSPYTPIPPLQSQLAAHADEIESKTRRRADSLIFWPLQKKRCSRLFSNYKSKTSEENPLGLCLSALASFNLSAMAQVKKFSPISNPIRIGRDGAGAERRRFGDDDDVLKVLSMQMTGQTTCRYSGNNNSNNNNNNSYVVIFTGIDWGSDSDSHIDMDIEHGSSLCRRLFALR